MRENQKSAMDTIGTTNLNSRSQEESLMTTESVSNRVAYNEMSDTPVAYLDPVTEVQKNLAHLEEVHARMRFMMREVRYLLKVQ